MNILIVTTSCNMLAPGHPTGLWLEEFALPFTAFLEAGASIRVASPQGGVVPIDPKTAPAEQEHEQWPDALDALNFTERLADVSANGFNAIFITGGHGPMVDLAHDSSLHELLAAFDREGKLIAAICHGPAALVNVRNSAGEPLVKGRKVTGFTNVEERLVMLHSVVPFLLEDALKERGANFEYATLPFFSHVVRDGNLITGQNPASSTRIAEEVLIALHDLVPRIRA